TARALAGTRKLACVRAALCRYLDPGRGLGLFAFAAVSLERLRQQAGLLGPVLEDVNETDRRIGALDAGLDQPELLGIAKPELVEPLGLGPADIARGGPTRGIGLLMMPNQSLPVFVSRLLHGFPDLRPRVGHV